MKLAFEMRCEADERLVADGWGTLVGYDYTRVAPRRSRKRSRSG